MSREEIFEKVRTLVAEKLGVDEDEVELTSSLEEDLGADSLDLVDLTMAIEDEFGVRVEDEELEKIKTVEDIVERLSKELGSDEEE
ncbi:MAG TPA: acyl carrier protein [Thermotogae bacterium]|nr:acyl carrier protein [Thermotogota bacterium]